MYLEHCLLSLAFSSKQNRRVIPILKLEKTNKENAQPCQKAQQDTKTHITAMALASIRYVAPANFKEPWSPRGRQDFITLPCLLPQARSDA